MLKPSVWSKLDEKLCQVVKRVLNAVNDHQQVYEFSDKEIYDFEKKMESKMIDCASAFFISKFLEGKKAELLKK